jgi:RecF/RecN/SMC N terminal domain.
LKDIRLTRLKLKNYKLFQSTTIEFSDGLNIFDGPNGYGKTSIFDAIEFVITGTIKRVTENSSINGSLKYDEIFLANDSSKDVIIKAEFNIRDEECKNKKIVIVKQVVADQSISGTTNCNPKKLAEITNTYLVDDFNVEELNSKAIIAGEKLDRFQKEFFGENSQNLFFMLYYVKQEDRLDFFKNTEKDRVKSIDSLFQIKQEQEKFKEINDGKKNLKSIIDGLDNEVIRLTSNLSKNAVNEKNNEILYSKLLSKNISWDLESVEINNEKEFDYIVQQLKSIKSVVKYVKFYREDLKNVECQRFLNMNEKDKQANLRAFCLYNEVADQKDKYIEKQKKFKTLQEQIRISEEGKFFDLDFLKLFEVMQIDISDNETEQIEGLIVEYKENRNSSVSAKQTLSDIIRIRQQLIDKFKDSEYNTDSKCPYCGFDWKDTEIFAKNVEITSDRLSKLVNGAEKKCLTITEKLKEIFENRLSVIMDMQLKEYIDDKLLMEFIQINSKENLQKYENMRSLFNKIGLESVTYKFTICNNVEAFEGIDNAINEKIVLLPAEYIEEKKIISYPQIIDLYFESLEDVEKIQTKNIDDKMSYIQNKFIESQSELTKKIIKLSDLKTRLTNELKKELENYSKSWKKSISRYQAQIISKIEIPFYIYSARILQSYQGGQGIFIRQSQNVSKGEVDSIRFTTPEQQHDVLYIMSSGQLSGVLLSFSLALNKVFVKDHLRTIFIDDPVQCMDDLNIVSFVELLRCEFESSQLIISTHEKSFANYISYKYKKHGLKRKNINLKDMAV